MIAEIRERADALFREGRSVPGDGADPVPRDGTTMEAAEIDARLPLLEHAFELPELARRLIVCLLAVEYDPALRPFVRSNQSELGRPWIELGSVAQLLALSPGEIPAIEEMVEEESCLHRFALVEVDAGSLDAPVVGRRLKLDQA